MTGATVTVVIPTYRRPQKLRRAIQSVLDQTYTNLVVKVFDNASRDDTPAVVSEMMSRDSRLQYFCHQFNIGMIENLNFAFDSVATPFFGFLSDDDFYVPTFLTEAMSAFQSHPDIQFVVLSAPAVDESGRILSDQLAAWPRAGVYAPGEAVITAVNGNHPVITTCLFRGTLAPELRLDKETDSIADLPVMIHLIARHPFYLSRSIGGYFVRHSEASGRNFMELGNFARLCSAYLRAERLIHDNLPANLPARDFTIQAFKRRVDRLFFFLMLESVTVGNAAAGQYLQERIRLRSRSTWQLAGSILGFAYRHVDPARLAASIRFSRGALRAIRQRRSK